MNARSIASKPATSISAMTEREVAEFWARSARGGKSECWRWTLKLDRGYGRCSIRGHTFRAHRVAFILERGEIPGDLVLDHLCRNRACVNPWHLEPVDIKTNVMRGVNHVAIQAKQTTCKRGHPLSGTNLRISPRGFRVCRSCEGRMVECSACGAIVRRCHLNSHERNAHEK